MIIIAPSQHPFLAGRRALVTGSSAGLGHALAAGLAAAGAGIVINGRSEMRLEESALALRDAGADVAILPFDATSPDDLTRAIDRFEEDTGPIDILVTATGASHDLPLADTSPVRLAETFDQIVIAAFAASRAAAAHMRRRGSGTIVVVCDHGPDSASAGVPVTAAANAALKRLIPAMAAEWGSAGVRVYGLCHPLAALPAGTPPLIADVDEWGEGQPNADESIADLVAHLLHVLKQDVGVPSGTIIESGRGSISA